MRGASPAAIRTFTMRQEEERKTWETKPECEEIIAVFTMAALHVSAFV